jgi:hypothetical protein
LLALIIIVSLSLVWYGSHYVPFTPARRKEEEAVEPDEIRRGLRRIRTKLERLRTLDPTYQHFGTPSHGYRLNPRLNLVVTGSEAGNIWHGWGCLPLPATPRGGDMTRLFDQINFSVKSSSVQYDRWVNAMLAPTNRERVTFLPWYEEDLDWKIKSRLGR